MNAILDIGRIPAACFDLKPQKTLRAGVLRQHLHRLEVWERPEQTQRLGLGQPADDLSLAEEPNHAAIRQTLQVAADLIRLQPCGAEAFRQAVSLHQVRRPARPAVGPHLKGGGQVLAASDEVVRRKTSKRGLVHHQHHGAEAIAVDQGRDHQRAVVGKAALGHGDVHLAGRGQLRAGFDLHGCVETVLEPVTTPSIPRSRNGRKMCSPPVDCRISSDHTLNSATCPAASVCP